MQELGGGQVGATNEARTSQSEQRQRRQIVNLGIIVARLLEQALSLQQLFVLLAQRFFALTQSSELLHEIDHQFTRDTLFVMAGHQHSSLRELGAPQSANRTSALVIWTRDSTSTDVGKLPDSVRVQHLTRFLGRLVSFVAPQPSERRGRALHSSPARRVPRPRRVLDASLQPDLANPAG